MLTTDSFWYLQIFSLVLVDLKYSRACFIQISKKMIFWIREQYNNSIFKINPIFSKNTVLKNLCFMIESILNMGGKNVAQ